MDPTEEDQASLEEVPEEVLAAEAASLLVAFWVEAVVEEVTTIFLEVEEAQVE